MATHESYRQFLLCPSYPTHIALEWLGKHLNLCMRIEREGGGEGGIENAFEIAIEPGPEHQNSASSVAAQLRQLHANGAMCSRATPEIAHQYWYT